MAESLQQALSADVMLYVEGPVARLVQPMGALHRSKEWGKEWFLDT